MNLKVEDRQCNVCNVKKPYVNLNKFLVLRDQMYQTIVKTQLNTSETDKEFFIDILTCVDTDILKAVEMFISAANIT